MYGFCGLCVGFGWVLDGLFVGSVGYSWVLWVIHGFCGLFMGSVGYVWVLDGFSESDPLQPLIPNQLTDLVKRLDASLMH